MCRTFLRALITAAVLLAGLGPSDAGAHERRVVGSYTVIVGFAVEPAFVEQMNGASILILDKDGKAVEGAEQTLKVEVTAAGESRTFDLKRDAARAGRYIAEFIPTRTGSYNFRFFGTIDGQDVNETFQSGPNRFDDVKSPAEAQFPVKVPTNGELAARAPTAGGSAGTAPAPAGPTSADLQRALDRADSARKLAIGFGIAGTLAGLAGMTVAAAALRSRNAGSRTGTSGRSEPV